MGRTPAKVTPARTKSLPTARASAVVGETEDPGPGSVCRLCNKQFPRHGPMRRHFEDIHQSGHFPCPGEGCGKVFSSKNKMSSHRSKYYKPSHGNSKVTRRSL